jgi:hypothetical protein
MVSFQQADGVGQHVLTRFDRDVSDIGERARDKIGAAAPRNLQPLGYRLGDPDAFRDDVSAAPSGFDAKFTTIVPTPSSDHSTAKVSLCRINTPCSVKLNDHKKVYRHE